MFANFLNVERYRKGFTLIELLLVIPLISIIFLIAYNIIFMSNKSFLSTKDKFSTYEDIRQFEINIQKESNQARKATKDDDVMKKINDKELHIYTDVSGDDIPELIRYRFENREIKKDIKYPILKSSNNQYPYTYENKWSDEKTVLKNVISIKIDEVNNVKEPDPTIITSNSKDHRKKTNLDIKIKNAKTKGIDLTLLLVTKSRTEAD